MSKEDRITHYVKPFDPCSANIGKGLIELLRPLHRDET